MLLVIETVALVIVSGPAVAVHPPFGQALAGAVGVCTGSLKLKLALPCTAGIGGDCVNDDPDWLCPGTGPLSLPGLKQLTG